MKTQAVKNVDVNALPAGARGFAIGYRRGNQIGDAIVNAVARLFGFGSDAAPPVPADDVPKTVHTPIDPVRLLMTHQVDAIHQVALLEVDGMELKVEVPAHVDEEAINRVHRTYLVPTRRDRPLPVTKLAAGPGLRGYDFLGALNGAPDLAPASYSQRPASMN